MEPLHQTSDNHEPVRVTDQEAAAMVELHARLNATRETGPTVRDVAEVLRISEAEALALFNQVRAEQSKAAQVPVASSAPAHVRSRDVRNLWRIVPIFLCVFAMMSVTFFLLSTLLSRSIAFVPPPAAMQTERAGSVNAPPAPQPAEPGMGSTIRK
jgi:hypothetical protein